MLNNYRFVFPGKTIFLLTLLVSLFFKTIQAQNLVTNGSFENGSATTCVTGSSGCFSAPGDCYFCNTTSTSTYFVPGWYLSDGNVDRFKAGSDPGADLSAGVPDSAWGLDMNGNTPGTIYQTVGGLTTGDTYQLSFYISNNTKSSSCAYDKPIRVTISNSVTGVIIQQTDYTTAGLSTAANIWGYRSTTFVSSGTSVTIEFQSLFGNAGTIDSCGSSASTPSFFGPALDNVWMVRHTVLPLHLISFNALHQADADVLISWTAANEADLKQYEVLHSADGNSFTVVNTVYVENDNPKGSYTYIHKAPDKSDKGFYRLKSLKRDGTLTFSTLAVVYHNGVLPPCQVQYAEQSGTFWITGITAGDLITVIDVLGKPVYQYTAHAQDNKIQLNNVPNGVYQLRITNAFKTQVLKILLTANR